MREATRPRITPIAVLMVIGSIVSIQVGTAIAFGLFDEVGIFGAVFLRTLIAALILALVWRVEISMLRNHPLLTFAFGFGLTAVTVCLYESIDRIPLGTAVTIEFMGPLGVALFTSRRRRDLLWVALAAAGVWLLTGGIQGGDLDPVGIAFACGAGLFWGGYILMGRRVGERSTGGSGLAVSMAVAAVLAAPFGIAEAGSDLLVPSVIGAGLVLALLSAAIPFSLEIEAMRRIPSGPFGVMMSLEPGIAAIVGLVILGQAVTLRECLAILLVVVASAGALRSAAARPTVQP